MLSMSFVLRCLVSIYACMIYVKIIKCIQGRIQEGVIGATAPLKPTKVILFTMILCNWENSIQDIMPFCRPLFCQSNVVKYTSFLVQ